MKKPILLLITIMVIALPFLGGCTGYETPRTKETRAKAELTAAEAYKTQAEGEAYAVKRQADAEAYSIRQEANEQMAITQQWIAERMAILREDQRDAAMMRVLAWVSVLAALSMPAQLGFMVWAYMGQKNRDAKNERKFYKMLIAISRGRR
jgi:regulator of protease activity HflC (stomatin/prohibitin superfamily)